MKKKLIAALLTVGMCLSMVACGSDKAPVKDKEDVVTETDETTDADENDGNDDVVDENMGEDANGDDAAGNDNAVAGETVGQSFYNLFVETVNANPDASAEDIASTMMAAEWIPFAGATMPVEQGLLNGFGNGEINGFEEGAMFAPMIGSIPFVGYVFTLADESTAEDFMATLLENADPRWNICTEADETVVEALGNKVFFLMCPTTFEE